MVLNPEQIDHINLINWFNYTYPALQDDLHHFANERKCTPHQGRILKRMGVKKGVADFFLDIPNTLFRGMWLELKVGSGKLSPEQVKFLERKTARGHYAMAAWGFESAKELINKYLMDIQ